jgi:glycosyltransferase involved in cell wall biosynthesis
MLQIASTPFAQRIGVVIEHLGSGGAEKVAVVLANGLANRGYAVDLLLWHPNGFYGKDVSPLVTKIDLAAGGKGGSARILRSLMQYLRQAQPLVVFTHLEKSSLLAIAGGLLTGYRRIVPCIHADLISYANSHHSLRRWLLNCMVALFYRAAPWVIAVSEGAGRTTRRLLSPFGPPVQVIYPGIDVPALLCKAQQPVKEAWLQKKTVPIIVACGRLTRVKAQDTLLRAFAVLRQTMPARLVILGEGEEHGALLSLAKELGVAEDVLLPGVVDNPIAWFAKSDLFVLASRSEGLSLVLIEALVAGVPIVSTDCPSGPREVLENGRFGVLVPVDNVSALSEAMSRRLNKTSEIDRALFKHLEKFSIDHMIDAHLRGEAIHRVESSNAMSESTP